MAGGRIQDIIKSHAKGARGKAPTRRNRTFHLSEDNVARLQRYSVSKGLAISKVIDELIGAFLEEAEEAGVLPPEGDKGG